MKRALFLHMGPGLNAYPDRILLEPHFSEIEFWDQPQAHGAHAFSDLVKAASEKLREMSQKTGDMTHLVAHSFGSHVATQLLSQHPDLVASLTLYNAGHDPVAGFHHLLSLLATSDDTAPSLRQEMRAFLVSHPAPSVETLWACLGLIVQDENFMRLYWTDPKLQEVYNGVSRSAPPLDFQTFQDVLNDFLRKRDSLPNSGSWKGSVKLILGSQDPLASSTLTEKYWRSFFPGLQIEIRQDSGHYSHLEEILRLKLEK